MIQTIRWKFLFIFATVLVAVYLILPSILRITGVVREGADPATLPGYLKFLPEQGVNLGLDLRGGLYVELDVDLVEAVKNRIDVLSMQIERSAKPDSGKPDLGKSGSGEPGAGEPEDFPDLKLERIADTEQVKVTLPPAKREAFLSFLRSDFGDVFQPGVSAEGDLTLSLTEAYSQHLKDMTLKQAVEAVRNRVDRYGVAEASLTLEGTDRIVLEIPGVTDPDRVINVIRKTGLLEFRMVEESVREADLNLWISEARAKENLTEGYAKETVEKLTAALKDKLPEGTEILYEVTRDPITREIISGTPYVVLRRADVAGDMLRHAQVGIENNEPYVSLSFNKIGTKNFGDLTKANIGKRLAIVLDGFVHTAPVIQTAITEGEAQISLGLGRYDQLMKEAEDLSLLLREGALPASLTVATRTVIGPSLGAESISKGLNSMLCAALAVVVFMMLYYKWGGMVANVALVLNVLFLFAILALLQASLTLPGIAGIVLTVGMAVDANVIIFERMREEIRAGRTAKLVVEGGYAHAMSAIIDSNLTTLISGVVLYQFGTGPIKGFATTLVIGIVTTLFTAVFVTRVIYDYFLYSKKIQRVVI